MNTSDVAFQVQTFIDYSQRGGPLSLEGWMRTKDFAPADRYRLRDAYRREAS